MFEFFKPGKKYMLWLSADKFWIVEFVEFVGIWGYAAKFRKCGQDKDKTTVVMLTKLVGVEEVD